MQGQRIGYVRGAHQSDRRLPLAQQRQGRRGQVQAVATAATGLACFIFRFLRRPPAERQAVAPGAPGQARAIGQIWHRLGTWCPGGGGQKVHNFADRDA